MKYFKLNEFSKSVTAKWNKIDNSIPEDVIPHIEELVTKVLDPLREFWNSPIIVSSGYRCNELNEVLKGAKHSAHLQGYACDIYPLDIDKLEEFKTMCIIYLRKRKFDQLIIYENFVHIGLYDNDRKQRKQILYM